ncbi:MAG TPA: VWA domain-containing protein, partial [Ktedonobacteraceae bacterium]|nr:VWA domain-containing protein [Ktedonobacteraceae bacterium]
MLTFEQPLLLLILLPIGLLVFLAWRRMSLPFPKAQRYMILACRLALFSLIVSALAGASLSLPVSRQSVVFVGDISASTTPQRAFIEQWISNAIRHKRPDDQVGIVAVGRNALVEQSVRTQIDFSQFESTPDTSYTDLAAGLRLAAAILPTDSERRIVLLSDGQQNLGDALQEAQLLQQEGIRLDVVPLPTFKGPEARIDDLSAPTELHTNERFLLHARLFSTVAQQVTLRLYLDQTLLLQLSLHLVVGEQDVSFNLLTPPAGFHTFRITLDAPFDTIGQNNEAAAFVNVQGPPHVLVIEGKPGAGDNIVAALQATHINVTLGTPLDVPLTLDQLAGYSTIVLADVPALGLGTTRMLVLQAFVRDLGRGLVVSGGENSYGVGGYAGTPLEQTLPLKMEIPQHKDTPTIAVVLIIESLESDLEVNISKEAAKGVVNLLTPRDQVGISDASGQLVIPMQHVTNRASINHAIDAMNPDDPPSYLPDLVNAESVLLHNNAKIKHVILLGDGDANDNYTQQVLKMASEHISISVVGTNIGSYQDLAMMQQIASLGKGRFYLANNPNVIPQILLKETQQAARRAIVEEPFIPAIVGAHPILTGLAPLPQLEGYVATTPKTAAQLVLISQEDDPVLAVWQYGLGRVAAWTSDALGLWTANWLRWSEAPRWWANLVTWTLPTPDSQLIVNGEIANGSGHVTVDLPPGTQIGAASQQQVQVKIIAPDLSQQTLTLQPTAPGRWEGNFPTAQVGAYLLRVTWQARNGNNATSQLTTTTGLVVPYSPEYLNTGTDLRFLKLLAQASGGSMLGPNDTAAAFSANLEPVYAALLITFWLFALAALLLPIDIALRRLSSLEFLVVCYRWLAIRLGLRKAALATEGTAALDATDNLV